MLAPFAVAAGHPSAAVDAWSAGTDPAIVRATPDGDRRVRLLVHSAAMAEDITVDVQRPADTTRPAPTLYLLNGAGGGEDAATWEEQTDALEFLADKHVNVVVPVGGKWSYYTDWRNADPVLGVNKWQTFLTRELPPVIDRTLHGNGVNAIAGLSASATSVLQLPISAPGLYRAAAAYSGCPQISDPIGRAFAVTVIGSGGGTASNMYGEAGDPMWAANDPYVHADQLRGLKLFLSSGTGVPGRYDTLADPRLDRELLTLLDQEAVGGTLEAAVNWCTHNMADRLDALGIPATVDFQPTGTHSWGYWQDELKKSWPVLAAGLGLPE
ncbi:esterase family protein [Nocardia sp. 2]|uniref:Esterase family protein n=1 Tax=Nocardia acididurans TaxID=2802282 RepID=A0ABS1MHA3_9NOCA|nr:esterase family protein [Nocardia acididurans]